MTEKEQLTFLNSQMTHCINSIKRIEAVLIGDEFNPKGMVQIQDEMKKEIESIKTFQTQQRTGWSLGKWLIGTSLGAYLLTQLSSLQHIIKEWFR